MNTVLEPMSAAAATPQRLEVEVLARRREAQDIDSFELVRVDGLPLPTYAAGAHIDVEIAPGLLRQYSLCGLPGAGTWRIAVLRDRGSRGGSRVMHDSVHPGQRLAVSQPRNLFALVPAPHTLLLAGGIGVTPILAMARELAASGASFEMHYCARRPDAMAFSDEIAEGPFAPRVRRYFSELADAARLDLPDVLAGAPDGTHLYVCGPEGFMAHAQACALAAGWGADRFHREHFKAVSPTPSAGGGFSMRLVRSGRVIDVAPETSALQALLDAGVDVPYSCETGICGTCLTRVLGGLPDHRDHYLADDERARNDQFTPCCSRAKTGELLLDL